MLKPYIQAFGYAFEGIAAFIKTERNAKVHLAASVSAVCLGVYLELLLPEWLWIASAVVSVLICEMINSAIEKLCNHITQEIDQQIKTIKDISAGFVLLASLYALLVAAIIFLPKVL